MGHDLTRAVPQFDDKGMQGSDTKTTDQLPAELSMGPASSQSRVQASGIKWGAPFAVRAINNPGNPIALIPRGRKGIVLGVVDASGNFTANQSCQVRLFDGAALGAQGTPIVSTVTTDTTAFIAGATYLTFAPFINGLYGDRALDSTAAPTNQLIVVGLFFE